mmetsp:Transcript_21081/g.24305  ORF Transcript_21081/g.24305 Transcript_21081/m.24305 type:complete len:100 (+) Transcript_21081:119-418(+)
MELTGTTGNTAVFSFRACESNEFCDFKNIETFQIFQRKDSAYSIPSTSVRKAYCVDRSAYKRNMYPGGLCDYDHQCLSGRCYDRCRGRYYNENCLSHSD